MPKASQKTKDLSSFLTPNSSAKMAANTEELLPSFSAATAAADFQAAIDKLRSENLESLANFQRECGAAISALQQVVDEHKTKIGDIEESLTDTCDRLAELDGVVARLIKENETMKKQLDYLSNYTRRENIRIIGLPESAETPDPANFICNLLREIFGPSAFEMPIIIDRIHRTAAPRPLEGDRPRPLLIRLHSYRVRELILRLASRHDGPILFKGKRIHFFPDVSPEVARLRSSFNAVKRMLHQANIPFRLFHPARLVFKWKDDRVSFTDPSKALDFINKHLPTPTDAEDSTVTADK